MSRLRQAIGPLIIGLAAWCAAGSLSVASSDAATARFAATAPLWIAVFILAIACAVGPWRHHPWTAAPAALAIIPWLPLPMSPVFLIFTGPMAWAPIVLSLALAVGLTPLRRLFSILNLFDPDDATVAALVLAAALGGWAAWANDPHSPGGDEPHYLIISTSLLKDRDLNIENNHRDRDYASFFGGELPPDFRKRGLHGEIYSIHAPGVPVLVAPMFQFFGYTGARITIVLLTAIASMLIWRIGWRATDSPEAAWFAWAAVILTPTFALHSFAVFPDGPGLLPVAAAVLLVVQLARGDRPGLLPVALTGIALAALPWMHTRFALVAGGLGAVIVLRMATMPWTTRQRLSRLFFLLAVPIVSALLWFYFFKVLYGTYDPRAPYPPEEQLLSWIGPAILGLFVDNQFGLATYAPAIAAVFVGFLMKPAHMSRRVLIELAAVLFVYLAAVTTVRMWWAGVPATPARFMVALLPMLAVPLAVVWTRVSQVSRTLLAGLVGMGATTTWLLLQVDRAALSNNTRNELPLWLEWLSPTANLSRVWPGFFWDEPRFPLHVLIVVAVAAVLWIAIKRQGLKPRVAASLWAIASVMILAPVGWAFTGAAPLDPAKGQLNVVRQADHGRPVLTIGSGHFGRPPASAALASLTLRPEEPGVKGWAAAPVWTNVPAGRYIARIRSSSAFPTTVRLMVARSGAPWSEFAVPGAGEFTFPFMIPATVGAVAFVTDPAMKSAVSVRLAVESAVTATGLRVRAAAQYRTSSVIFLDDMTFVEPDGFWVRGKQDAEFLVVPLASDAIAITLFLRNGAMPNVVSVESGLFQRVLTLEPGAERQLSVPVISRDGTTITVASGESFVPAENDPASTDRRALGVWVEIR
jgi:hypothetical protein